MCGPFTIREIACVPTNLAELGVICENLMQLYRRGFPQIGIGSAKKAAKPTDSRVDLKQPLIIAIANVSNQEPRGWRWFIKFEFPRIIGAVL